MENGIQLRTERNVRKLDGRLSEKKINENSIKG